MRERKEIELKIWNSNHTPKYQVKEALIIIDKLKILFSKSSLLNNINTLLNNLLKIYDLLDKHYENKNISNKSNYESQLEEDNFIDIKLDDNIRTLCKQIIRFGKQLIIHPEKISTLSKDQAIIDSFSSLKNLSELIIEQYVLLGKDKVEFKVLRI